MSAERRTCTQRFTQRQLGIFDILILTGNNARVRPDRLHLSYSELKALNRSKDGLDAYL